MVDCLPFDTDLIGINVWSLIMLDHRSVGSLVCYGPVSFSSQMPHSDACLATYTHTHTCDQRLCSTKEAISHIDECFRLKSEGLNKTCAYLTELHVDRTKPNQTKRTNQLIVKDEEKKEMEYFFKQTNVSKHKYRLSKLLIQFIT